MQKKLYQYQHYGMSRTKSKKYIRMIKIKIKQASMSIYQFFF